MTGFDFQPPKAENDLDLFQQYTNEGANNFQPVFADVNMAFNNTSTVNETQEHPMGGYDYPVAAAIENAAQVDNSSSPGYSSGFYQQISNPTVDDGGFGQSFGYGLRDHALQMCVNPSLLSVGTPQKHPHLTVAQTTALNANDKFFDRVVSLIDPNTGVEHKRTYRELRMHYPSLRLQVLERFELWKKIQSSCQAFAPLPVPQTKDEFEKDLAFTHHHRSSTSPEADRKTPNSSGGFEAVSSSIIPLLETVPKRRGSEHAGSCPSCKGKLIVNGKNDGIICTRCFNRKNRDIEYQNAVNMRHNCSEENSSESNIMTQNLALSADQKSPDNMIIDDLAGFESSISTRKGHEKGQHDSITGATGLTSHLPAVVPSIEHEPASHDDLIESDSENDDIQELLFDIEHASVDEAREFLVHRPASACQSLNLATDDWRSVKDESFEDLCVELLQGLLVQPVNAPSHLTHDEASYFEANHLKTFKAVTREMKTPEQISMVKARVMVALDEVVRVHEIGIPKTVFDKSHAKTHRGYEPDIKTTCGERARKVIDYARINKYVALDIIRGKNMEYLAQAPDKYVERKMANIKTNSVRGEKLQMAKQLKKGEGPPKSRKRKRTTQVQLDSPEPDYPSKASNSKKNSGLSSDYPQPQDFGKHIYGGAMAMQQAPFSVLPFQHQARTGHRDTGKGVSNRAESEMVLGSTNSTGAVVGEGFEGDGWACYDL